MSLILGGKEKTVVQIGSLIHSKELGGKNRSFVN